MTRRSWEQLPPSTGDLAKPLISWFNQHGRSYPWRTTTDPFLILSAEIMLQRTRADQVAPVFRRYADRLSKPRDVLDAGRDYVDRIFSGLGLRWRADTFWELHQRLDVDQEGVVPSSYEELKALPGVGPYVATAVRVFSFGASETVVDSNVLRILGRYFGVDFPDHARRSPRVLEWASNLAPRDSVDCRKFNWALIDLGAQVCTPTDPVHDACPIAEECWIVRSL